MPTPKKTTPAVRAAQLYNRLLQLRQERDDEIANAPQSIALRYQKREAKMMARYSSEERELAERMMGE